ncbi:hypothetical protein [Loigolactobacillus binensis]|uniref:Uncharacterized protein n=1 Tax=Loigolactobacillus binensis TaxID=2559922 RepID=A0ABW3EF92_9LACO|nr:hypothetical protein [Loigolactobacillus binensis]
MSRGQRQPGKAYADLLTHFPQTGQVKLTDFAQQFAAVYHGEATGHAHTLADR